MYVVCELAEVLRDALVEYQVSLNLKAHDLVDLPEHWVVCPTEGNV